MKTVYWDDILKPARHAGGAMRITDRARGDGKLILDRLSHVGDVDELIELLLEAGHLRHQMPDAKDFLDEVHESAAQAFYELVDLL